MTYQQWVPGSILSGFSDDRLLLGRSDHFSALKMMLVIARDAFLSVHENTFTLSCCYSVRFCHFMDGDNICGQCG